MVNRVCVGSLKLSLKRLVLEFLVSVRVRVREVVVIHLVVIPLDKVIDALPDSYFFFLLF